MIIPSNLRAIVIGNVPVEESDMTPPTNNFSPPSEPQVRISIVVSSTTTGVMLWGDTPGDGATCTNWRRIVVGVTLTRTYP